MLNHLKISLALLRCQASSYSSFLFLSGNISLSCICNELNPSNWNQVNFPHCLPSTSFLAPSASLFLNLWLSFISFKHVIEWHLPSPESCCENTRFTALDLPGILQLMKRWFRSVLHLRRNIFFVNHIRRDFKGPWLREKNQWNLHNSQHTLISWKKIPLALPLLK